MSAVSDQSATTDVPALRALWCAVLMEQWLLSFRSVPTRGASPEIPNEAQAACHWFGSADFGQVCRLAGVDPQAVMDRWRRKQAAWEAEGRPPRWLEQVQYRRAGPGDRVEAA